MWLNSAKLSLLLTQAMGESERVVCLLCGVSARGVVSVVKAERAPTHGPKAVPHARCCCFVSSLKRQVGSELRCAWLCLLLACTSPTWLGLLFHNFQDNAIRTRLRESMERNFSAATTRAIFASIFELSIQDFETLFTNQSVFYWQNLIENEGLKVWKIGSK